MPLVGSMVKVFCFLTVYLIGEYRVEDFTLFDLFIAAHVSILLVLQSFDARVLV